MRLGLLLAVALGTATLPNGVAAQAIVFGVSGNVTGLRNQVVRVPVFADLSSVPGTKLGSYTVRVSWNPNILSLNSVSILDPDQGSFATPRVQADSASAGVLYLAAISAAGRAGVFDLFSLVLAVDSSDSSPITVQVFEASAAGTLVDLMPSVVAVNGTFCPGRGRWGDLDDDGAANSRDALAILSSVVGLAVDTNEFKMSLGDVDGDTKVNSRDALIVLSYGVGLPVPGTRILFVASTACSTGAPPSLSFLPDTVDVVRHQTVQLQLVAKGAGGRPVALNGANWRVTDGRLATVDFDGLLTAVDTGVTTVEVSIGPSVQTTAPLIVRTRRPVWHVDPHVARATVQLGNARFPFETPEFAFELLTEGDTIRIHPGAVDWHSNGGNMTVGAVILGDTLTDGTRPILRGQVGETNNGFSWRGGRHGTVANLVLKEFGAGIRNRGLANLIVRNVRIETQEGDGLLSLEAMDTLQVFNSVFSGDSSNATGSGIVVNGALRVALNKVQATGWAEDGVLLNAADTLDMQQSNVSGNRGLGLHMIDPTGKGLVTVSHSRFVNNDEEQVSIAHARDVRFDHNYIQNIHKLAMFLEHPDIVEGSTFRSVKDSIRDRAFIAELGKDWIFTSVDSVFIDSLWVENPHDSIVNSGAQFHSRFVQIKNSQFLNVYNKAFQFDGNRLIVDSSTFTGCGVVAVCGWGQGIAIVMVEGLGGTGLGEGPFGLAKGSALVTNSSFFAIEAALETGTTSFVGPIAFNHNVVDSVSFAVIVDADTMTANDNVVTRLRGNGLYADPGLAAGLVTMLRNQINCTQDDLWAGIITLNQPANIADNGVHNCLIGIQASADGAALLDVIMAGDTVFPYGSTLSTGFYFFGSVNPTLVRNRIVGGGTGMYFETLGGAVIDSNSVSATTQAAVSFSNVPGQITGRKNNIANNLLDGIMIFCSGSFGAHVPLFTLGRFVGNAGFGIVTQECSDSVDARQNWWGLSSGPHSGLGSDSVSSVRIATGPTSSDFLTSDPSNVPPLAPRFFSSASAAWSQSGRSAGVRAARPPRLVAVPASARALASTDPASAAQRAQLRAARLARDAAVVQALKARAASLPPPRR